MKLMIESKKIGSNGLEDLRSQIDLFVKDNFDTLYEGAVRLGCHIEADYWAPKRIQHEDTRLHGYLGLKYADGHKYDDDQHITEGQLKNTIKHIQELLDKAAEDIPAPFKLEIKKV